MELLCLVLFATLSLLKCNICAQRGPLTWESSCNLSVLHSYLLLLQVLRMSWLWHWRLAKGSRRPCNTQTAMLGGPPPMCNVLTARPQFIRCSTVTMKMRIFSSQWPTAFLRWRQQGSTEKVCSEIGVTLLPHSYHR
ncbi:hypothetical protein FKM82_015449 [Ascaphus truei]